MGAHVVVRAAFRIVDVQATIDFIAIVVCAGIAVVTADRDTAFASAVDAGVGDGALDAVVTKR